MPEGPIKPLWTSANILLYFGGFLVLAAAAWLLGLLAEDHGEAAFAGLAALVLAVVAALAFALRARERPIAAGLFAVVTAVVFGVFVAALEDVVGLLPESTSFDDGFSVGRLLAEAATLAGALALLRLFRFPLLVLVAGTTGWLLVADTITDGGDWLAIVSVAVGLVYAVLGSVVARPYGMWLHVLAGLLVGGGLLNFWSQSDLDWILVLLVSLAYMAVADALDRTSYAVLGTLGAFAAATHFVEKWLELPDPFAFVFGGQPLDVDDVSRPLVYAGIGLAFVGAGLLIEARRRARTALATEPAPDRPAGEHAPRT